MPFYWSRAEREQAERIQRLKDQRAAEENQFERSCEQIFLQLNPLMQRFLSSQRDAGRTPQWREDYYKVGDPVLSAGKRCLSRLGWSISGRFNVNAHTSNLTLFPDGDWKLTYCGTTFCVGASSGELFYAGKLMYFNEPVELADVIRHAHDLLEGLKGGS